MPKRGRDERGRGTECVKASAVDGVGNAVCKRSVLCTIDAKTVGGEARRLAEIGSPGGVYVYFAYNGALESMGEQGYLFRLFFIINSSNFTVFVQKPNRDRPTLSHVCLLPTKND